jgi:hypothetical protein
MFSHELNPFPFRHGHYPLKGEVEVGLKKKTDNSSTFTTSFLLARPPIPCGGGAQHLSTKHEMPADKVTWTSSENADPATA